MKDREKVIKGLETCRTRVHCKECPYAYDKRANDSYCEAVLHNDALALLKEQEASSNRKIRYMCVIYFH